MTYLMSKYYLSKLIVFTSRKKAKELFNNFELSYRKLLEDGMTEEDAVASLNINQIAKDYQSNNNIDYLTIIKRNEARRDLLINFLSCALCLGMSLGVYISIPISRCFFTNGISIDINTFISVMKTVFIISFLFIQLLI